jgi:hypothetical protein
MTIDDVMAIVKPHNDKLLAEAQLARAMEVLRGLVLVCGTTGDSLEDFEEQAEAFRRETGFHRPGKDLPAARGSFEGDDYETRRIKFDAWVQMKIEAARELIRLHSSALCEKSE